MGPSRAQFQGGLDLRQNCPEIVEERRPGQWGSDFGRKPRGVVWRVTGQKECHVEGREVTVTELGNPAQGGGAGETAG